MDPSICFGVPMSNGCDMGMGISSGFIKIQSWQKLARQYRGHILNMYPYMNTCDIDQVVKGLWFSF